MTLRATYGERALRIEQDWLGHRLSIDGVLLDVFGDVEWLKSYAIEHLHIGGSIKALEWTEEK